MLHRPQRHLCAAHGALRWSFSTFEAMSEGERRKQLQPPPWSFADPRPPLSSENWEAIREGKSTGTKGLQKSFGPES
ncbi:hypothetical protein PVAP13_4KG048663 [Panicum virgatum]|uniref:Uncharacterized protein n=1 Tax=Panicum virgatum TaxID=38727 RepID=A0A8T0TCM7_PANVG|nr:hypothetical protein PVAP13_4KG048663 [Panicum virgatum]